MPISETPSAAAWSAAVTYINAQTHGFPGPWAPLFTTVAYRAALAQVEAGLTADDLPTTQAACRQVWTLALGYARACAVEAPGEAVPHA